MIKNNMKEIIKEIEYLYVEKKSEFIVNLKKINSKEEANKIIKEISEKYQDANHNVYAYRVIENGLENIKYSDDGEPLNTAGKPVFEIINKLDIVNVLIIVSRYFGGIKLGAGGLIRAYAKSAKLAIDEVGLKDYINKKNILIEVEYTNSPSIEYFLISNNVEILEKSYTDKVYFKISIEEEKLNILKDKNIVIIEL